MICLRSILNSGEERRDLLESRSGAGFQQLGSGQEIPVRHSASEKCPTRRLLLYRKETVGLAGCKCPASGTLQAIEIELHLLHQSGIQHAADFEIAVDCVRALLIGAGIADFVNHEGIELGMLGLFHPVMSK